MRRLLDAIRFRTRRASPAPSPPPVHGAGVLAWLIPAEGERKGELLEIRGRATYSRFRRFNVTTEENIPIIR